MADRYAMDAMPSNVLSPAQAAFLEWLARNKQPGDWITFESLEAGHKHSARVLCEMDVLKKHTDSRRFRFTVRALGILSRYLLTQGDKANGTSNAAPAPGA